MGINFSLPFKFSGGRRAAVAGMRGVPSQIHTYSHASSKFDTVFLICSQIPRMGYLALHQPRTDERRHQEGECIAHALRPNCRATGRKVQKHHRFHGILRRFPQRSATLLRVERGRERESHAALLSCPPLSAESGSAEGQDTRADKLPVVWKYYRSSNQLKPRNRPQIGASQPKLDKVESKNTC